MVTGLGRVYASQSIKAKVLRRVTKTLYRRAFKGCDRVIFQNRDDVNEFVKERYLPEKKTAVVNGSGVNMERFCRMPIPEKPVFLMVSRIIKEKGVLEYAAAARFPGTYMSRNFTIHAAKDGVVTFVKTKKTHFSGRSVPRVRVEVR